MLKNRTEDHQIAQKLLEQLPAKQALLAALAVILCALAYVLCVLMSVSLLQRMGGYTLFQYDWIAIQLAKAGAWLPNNLHLSTSTFYSQTATSNVEFLLLMAMAFAIYGLCALCISLSSVQGKKQALLLLIWLCPLVSGLILLFAPDLLSKDMFVYAGIGRLLVSYSANPFFVPASVYPHDPLYYLNGWTTYTSSYGPLWVVICALSTLISGTHALAYVIFFRSLGLAAHLLNILLVTVILSKMGRSPRTVALGAQLYAWNPLILLEASHNGHNDILMITFILLGILLAVPLSWVGLVEGASSVCKGEGGVERSRDPGGRPSWSLPRNSILPVIAFTLAALIKFTSVSVLVLFLIALACMLLRPATAIHLSLGKRISLSWKHVLLTVCLAGIVSTILALIFYLPFWIGHNLSQIINSFTSPPYTHGVHKSLEEAIQRWSQQHPLPAHTWMQALVYIFSRPNTWEYINIAALVGVLLLGTFWLWKLPSIRTFVLASLALLGAFLVVTPWFLPWYATWLVALAVVCLPVLQDRLGRALVAFALVFSASAFFLYLYNGNPVFGLWSPLSSLLTLGPPLLAFLLFVVIPISVQKRHSNSVPDAVHEKIVV